jgi:hypothetical protein
VKDYVRRHARMLTASNTGGRHVLCPDWRQAGQFAYSPFILFQTDARMRVVKPSRYSAKYYPALKIGGLVTLVAGMN